VVVDYKMVEMETQTLLVAEMVAAVPMNRQQATLTGAMVVFQAAAAAVASRVLAVPVATERYGFGRFNRRRGEVHIWSW